MSQQDRRQLDFLLRVASEYQTSMGLGLMFDRLVDSRQWDEPEVATPKHLRGK